MNNLVALKQIGKVYPKQIQTPPLLSGIDLSINTNDFIIISGPRGSGKSTLMNIIGLLDHPTTGCVEFQGRKLNKSDDNKMSFLRNNFMGYVFQKLHYIPELSVLDNIQLPLLYRTSMDSQQKETRLNNVLSFVKLTHMMRYHYPDNLSRFQKLQMVFARALVSNPSLLLVDEPTARLDPYSRDMVIELLRNILKNQQISLVLVTKDSYLVGKLNNAKILLLPNRV